MPLNLTFTVETPEDLCRMVLGLGERILGGDSLTAAGQAHAAKTEAETVEVLKAGKTKKTKPAEPQTIEGTATASVEPASDVPMLTVDDARERMKTFAKNGHLQQIEAALAHFKAKKVSDIDPDAKGKLSAKFAAFVAKIEELIANAPKTENADA